MTLRNSGPGRIQNNVFFSRLFICVLYYLSYNPFGSKGENKVALYFHSGFPTFSSPCGGSILAGLIF